jgi:hypothetical protein
MSGSEDQHQPPGRRAYLRLIGIAALIGIPAALLAAAFLGAVHLVEGWLWDDLPAAMGLSAPPWYLVLGLPVIGAVIVLVARRFLPGDGGAPPMHGLSTEATPVSHAPGVVLAALGSLPFGAVLGPELPVVALGTAVGLLANRFARLAGSEAAVLSNAGAFSAISALFGGPLVAGMLLVEGGLSAGAALLPALLPGLVAAAIGYLIFVGVGTFAGLGTPGLVVPDLPVYTAERLTDLLVGVLVGVLAVLVITLVRAIAVRTDGLRGRIGLPDPAARWCAGSRSPRTPGRRPRGRPAGRALLRAGRDSGGGQRRLDLGGGRPAADQAAGVRDQPGLRLPGRADLPGHLPGSCAGGLRRPRPWNVADAGGLGRCGGRHGRPDAAPLLASPAGGAARRLRWTRHHPGGGARRDSCLADGRSAAARPAGRGARGLRVWTPGVPCP